MSDNEIKILENKDNFFKKNKSETKKIKVLDSFKRTKRRSITRIPINQSNFNRLNFFSLIDNKTKDINRKSKKNILHNIENNNNFNKSPSSALILKNFNQSPPFTLTNNNFLSHEKIFSRYNGNIMNLNDFSSSFKSNGILF